MPGFKSIKTNYELKGKDLHTLLEVDLDDDLKVKLAHQKNNNALLAELEGDNWQVKYNFQNKDFAFEFEREVKPGKLKVRQHVPDHQWSVFPSPYVQLSTKMLEGDNMKDRLKLSYDFNTAVAGVEETVWMNDKKHKLKVVADNKTNLDGAVFSLKTKTDNRMLKSVGLKFNRNSGSTVVLKSKPLDDLKVKAHVHLQTSEVAAEFELKPDAIDNTEFTLRAKVPYSGENRFNPAATVGMKYKF